MQTCLEALTWPAANNSHPRAVVSNDAAEVQKRHGTQAAQNDQKIRDMQKKLLAWHAHPSNAFVNICCKCVQRHLIHSLNNKAKKRARSIIQDMQKKLLAWHAHPSNALVNICCKCVQKHLIHCPSNKAKKRARSIIQGTTGIIKHGVIVLYCSCQILIGKNNYFMYGQMMSDAVV